MGELAVADPVQAPIEPRQADRQELVFAAPPIPWQAPHALPNMVGPVRRAPEPLPDPAEIQRLANDIFVAGDGDFQSDGSAITDAFLGRSPAEILALRAEFATTYQQNLDGFVEREVGVGQSLDEIQRTLAGDPVGAAVLSLRNASEFYGGNDGKVLATLEAIDDPMVRQEVLAQFESETGRTIDSMMEEQMRGTDLELGRAFLDGDPVTAAAIQLVEAGEGGLFGFGVDETAMVAQIEALESPEDRQRLEELVAARTGEPAEQFIRDRLGFEEGDRAMGLLNADPIAVAAAELQMAPYDPLELCSIFGTLDSAADREAAVERANANVPAGFARFEDNIAFVGPEAAEAVAQCRATGDADPGLKIDLATSLINGTDEAALLDTVRGMSDAELAAYRARTATAGRPSLEATIAAETSGALEFEALQAARGPADTPQEQGRVIDESQAFYREGAHNWLGRVVTDGVLGHTSGRLMDDNATEARAVAADGQVTPSEAARLGVVADDHGMHGANYGAARMTGSKAVTGTASALAGGVGSFFGGPVGGTLAAGAVNIISSSLMQGPSYGAEEIGTDALGTAADLAAGGLTSLPAVDSAIRALAGVPGQASTLFEAARFGGVKAGVDAVVGNVADLATDERTLEGEVSLGDVLPSAAQLARGAVGGALRAGDPGPGTGLAYGAASGLATTATGMAVAGATGDAPSGPGMLRELAVSATNGALAGVRRDREADVPRAAPDVTRDRTEAE